MTTVEFLTYLRSLEVHLWIEGAQLRFSAPSNTVTSTLRAELAERKQDIVAFLREASVMIRSTAPPLARVSREGNLPLSFAQQRLWFLDQLEPGSSPYNAPEVGRLKGALDLAALERSLAEIVRRHESLRTTFAMSDGAPAQVIAPPRPVRLPVVDLTDLPDPERETEARRLILQEARRPFDLARGPLLRATLLRLGDQEHVLLLNMHHIVSDAWSFGVFKRELAALYNVISAGEPSPLLDPPVQYADFAVWQREWLKGEVLEEHFSYWKEQLAGAPAVLELPTDRPRPAVQGFRGAKQTLQIAEPLSEALKTLSHKEGTTLFMTLLAAFQALLYRYTGQTDLVVGSPIANRNRFEIEGLIGFLTNTLIFRTDLSGNPTFRELLSRVREVALGAYAHQDLPFEKLVEKLQPERDLSYNPLFQVVFVLQNAATPAPEPRDLRIEWLELDLGTAKFDLTLSLEERKRGLVGWMEYSTDLFDAATISRMAGHFQNLLSGIAADPGQRLSELPLLTEPERRELLVEWNDTRTEYPPEKCLHELFEAQVERTPEAVAVVFEGERLTYRELNRRANQLAHRLRELGVTRDVLVGLCVERSPEMVVGLLGILKAGGAYVPLDLAYPKERAAFLLRDARTPVLVTQPRFASDFAGCGARVVCLDEDRDFVARESGENPGGVTRPDDLAYVIYTSGSTGMPKGVQVTHSNVVRLFEATQRWFRFDQSDSWTLFHSYAFDFSVWELWGALLFGGRLVVVPYLVTRSPEDFYDLLCREGVTVLNQTPSAFRQLIQAEESSGAGRKLALRLVILGGEALEPQDLKPWFDRHGDERPQLVNMYGITETTVHVTYRPLTASDLSAGWRSVIGRPIPDLQVYVLDPYRQPVPVGVRGEIYVGGAGLARGYLNRPELTAERFVGNPFRDEPDSRLYRSGDLGRFLPGGDIEYLGRIDNQAKIRGFRIEPAEIEAALDQHPAVAESVVLCREDRPGEKQLVAYLVAEKREAPTVSELRSFLKQKLPEYMVPSAFVALDRLPLTPNGKVDRRALPAPGPERPALEGEFAAPRTPAEEVLCRIWAEVLRIEKVGRYDNFFELGGDSILSIHIVAKARQAGLRVTPKQLFQQQTVAELAAVAGAPRALQAQQGAVTGGAPLTPIQHWFFEQRRPDPHHYNQAFLFEVSPELDLPLIEKAVNEVLRHHDALRLRFSKEESGWCQTHAEPSASLSLTRVHLSRLPEGELVSAIASACGRLQGSLNLSEGPLLRAAHLELGGRRPGRLLLIVHHLTVDGVSWRILMEDLESAYKALRRGGTVKFPPKTTSFQQWSGRLTEYARSGALDSEQDYWLAEPGCAATALPIDHRRGRNTEASARTVSVSLSTRETEALLQEVPAAYNTQINDALLTALVRSFARWTDSQSLLIDLEGHGREELFDDMDLSRTVGWFTAIFPVRLDVSEAEEPVEALKSVKEQLRRIPGKGVGYGVQRYLSGNSMTSEKLRSLPRAEVVFNYLGQFDSIVSGSSLFAFAGEPTGPWRSPRGIRRCLFEINSAVKESRLRVDWTFSENFHKRETVEGLAQAFVEELESLIAHCRFPEAGGYTPSDFPEADLNQKELDGLLARLAGSVE